MLRVEEVLLVEMIACLQIEYIVGYVTESQVSGSLYCVYPLCSILTDYGLVGSRENRDKLKF